MKANDVIDTLPDLLITHGLPKFIRSDNGAECVAEPLRIWFRNVGVTTVFIESASPWENGYIESFNGKFRDE